MVRVIALSAVDISTHSLSPDILTLQHSEFVRNW